MIDIVAPRKDLRSITIRILGILMNRDVAADSEGDRNLAASGDDKGRKRKGVKARTVDEENAGKLVRTAPANADAKAVKKAVRK